MMATERDGARCLTVAAPFHLTVIRTSTSFLMFRESASYHHLCRVLLTALTFFAMGHSCIPRAQNRVLRFKRPRRSIALKSCFPTIRFPTLGSRQSPDPRGPLWDHVKQKGMKNRKKSRLRTRPNHVITSCSGPWLSTWPCMPPRVVDCIGL